MATKSFTLLATTGNDSQTINEPNSIDQWKYVWDGLAGTDSLSFDRLPQTDFTIYKNATGIHVDSVSSASHMIYVTLNNVETLKFSKGGTTVNLSALFDTVAPTLIAASPADESVAVALASNLLLTFSETVQRGTGNMVLRDAAGTVIETYNAATSSNLSISGSVLTVNPTANLSADTTYYLELAAGTVTDTSGNAYAGTQIYNFTTVSSNNLPTGSVNITGTATQGQQLTASNTLADADGLGVVSYQWKADGTAISGANSSTYTLTQAEVGKAITVTASYSDALGTAESKTSTATAAVVNVNDLPTGSVNITGTATQGQQLTASNTLADADGLGVISYQWKADGTAISGASSSTYTLTQAEVGKAITVTASYSDALGTAESKISTATAAVVNVNDLPTGSVNITGTATQGQQLTASNTLADADGLGVISYQWKADGTAISGANSSTYTLTQAEVGKAITVTASYSDALGTAESKISTATAAVVNVNDLPTGSVNITGTATQGQQLTASNTLADADGLGVISYQWKADGTAISGANSSTYTLTQAEVGKAITVTASYSDALGTAESKTSTATAAVVNVNDLPTGSVNITGTATQGQQLTASNTLADADGLGVISYQWKADGTAISGASSSTYTLTQAEVGKAITVTASYSDALGTAESKISTATAAVVNVNDLPTGSVNITGTATQGQQLTASNTLADADGLGVISYQWKADGTAISGASSSTYTLTQAEVGKAITVTASYSDALGTAESKTSAATTAVITVDTTEPTVSSFNPTDAATDVAIGSNIVLTFSEAIQSGVGTIQIRSGSATGTVVETFDAANSAQLGISGATLTINPTRDLDYSTQYFVTFAFGSIRDLAGNSYAGTNSFEFTTLDIPIDIRTATSKYFVLAGSEANHVDYQFQASSLSLRGQFISQVGTTGVDTIHVRPGSAIDFTASGASADKIYLDGVYGDYGVSLTGSVMTLYRGSGVSRELVRFGKAANLISSDMLVFADGSVNTWDLFNRLKSGTELPAMGSETSHQALAPAAQGSPLNATIKAFAVDSNGETFASVGQGMQLVAVGSVGLDTVYVGDGSTVDATLLGASSDLIYLRGGWADYSKSVSGSVITFSRSINGQMESVKIIGGNGALNDKLIFADGAVLSNDARMALSANLDAAIQAVTGYDPDTTTPGLRPMLQASVLDNVSSFDVSSDMVLSYSESVTAQTGKYIRIVDDGGMGFRGESSNHTQIIEVTDSTQVSIVGGKVTLRPAFDLDLANNYHIEIDAGAFLGLHSGQATEVFNGSTSLNFATVTPGTGALANAVASQAMDVDGQMVAGHRWLDIEGVGSPSGSAVGLNLDGFNYALVAKDYDARGGNSSSGYDGVMLGDLNVGLNSFGLGDLIYIDDQGNRLDAQNDLGLTAVIDAGRSPTQIQFAGTGLGGFVEVSVLGSTASFDSINAFNLFVGNTAVILG